MLDYWLSITALTVPPNMLLVSLAWIEYKPLVASAPAPIWTNGDTSLHVSSGGFRSALGYNSYQG